MADYTQANHTFIAQTHFTAGTTFAEVGTADDVSGYLSGTVYIDHAPIEDATANDPGITYEVQIAGPAVANGDWTTIATFTASTTASTMETLDGSSSATTIPVAATGDVDVRDHVYLRDDSDGAGATSGSEWAQVDYVTDGESFAVLETPTYSYTTGEDVFILGVARWAVDVDLAGVSQLRVVVWNPDDGGHNWASRAYARYATAIE